MTSHSQAILPTIHTLQLKSILWEGKTNETGKQGQTRYMFFVTQIK